MHIEFNPKGHSSFTHSHWGIVAMNSDLWDECIKLESISPSWPFGSMASYHSALGYCQVGGSLDQRHLGRCCGRQVRTAARTTGVGRFHVDPTGSLRRGQPFSALHGRDVQHQGESETLLLHLGGADLRWHEYGAQVLLLGLS